ncbi:MAG: DUF4861 domain-containing protein [Tannerellaceae bacterium]|jgi:hypothetical protein|nr:DUF4861 domain-containing protein [Tannerellaceae bacterium]
MNKSAYLFFLCICICTAVCSAQSEIITITVQNPADFDRETELVELPMEALKERMKLTGAQVYEVKNSRGTVIPSQYTSDGKLIFPSGMKAKETTVFTISAGNKQTFKAMTYGRFVEERKDDFAWENDRVAFRIYGKALIPTDGPSNGLDIWYKRTGDLVINKWYEADLTGRNSYHNDNGEGLDDYKVGRTLGAGAMAPYAGNKLWLNENFIASEMLDNGPLRTTFKLTYKDILVDGKHFPESRTFSIDAGSQLTKVTQEYGTTEAIPVAAGVIKRSADDPVVIAPDRTYILYPEPATDKAEGIYIGLVFPEGAERILMDAGHTLVVTTYTPDTPLTYYAGYGWKKFGFENETQFRIYLENFVKSRKQPLIIRKITHTYV